MKKKPNITLDGKEIKYAKDWKGAVERMDNSKAHTLTFQWKPLAQELKDAGYTYRTKCEHYISGSTAVQKTETIAANKTSHTVTIPAGADPKVYSFALHLNLKKDGSSIGIYSNEHIVKLVVSEAPEVKTLTGKVNYTNGAVFGQPILFSGTIKENMRWGNQNATDEEIIAAAKASHAHGFIKRLPQGYDTVIAPGGGNLSAGQKQLLCIARIMLCQPQMLILDEATSSIDTRTEMLVQQAFEKLMQGRTSFVVAHRLSTIQSADRILVMNAGHIIEQGTHAELLAKQGFYANLYNSQFAVE